MKKIILLFFLFIISMPSVLSGPLDKIYECQYVLDIDYDVESATTPFLPVDMAIDIPLTFNLKVVGVYAELMMPYYNGELYNRTGFDTYAYLYVNNTPSWCTATISPYMLVIPVDSDWESINATLHIKVDEKSYAFQDGNIELRVRITKLGAILERTFYVAIPFRVGYLPLLKIDVGNTTKSIGPLELAIFDISIENLGNAKTNVLFNVIDAPDEWEITTVTNLTIGTKVLDDTYVKGVYLTVKPSDDIGYHQDREIIQVSLTPVYYNDSGLRGEEYLLSFIVQSQGFSTSGFECILVFVILIGLMFGKGVKHEK